MKACHPVLSPESGRPPASLEENNGPLTGAPSQEAACFRLIALRRLRACMCAISRAETSCLRSPKRPAKVGHAHADETRYSSLRGELRCLRLRCFSLRIYNVQCCIMCCFDGFVRDDPEAPRRARGPRTPVRESPPAPNGHSAPRRRRFLIYALHPHAIISTARCLQFECNSAPLLRHVTRGRDLLTPVKCALMQRAHLFPAVSTSVLHRSTMAECFLVSQIQIRP